MTDEQPGPGRRRVLPGLVATIGAGALVVALVIAWAGDDESGVGPHAPAPVTAPTGR